LTVKFPLSWRVKVYQFQKQLFEEAVHLYTEKRLSQKQVIEALKGRLGPRAVMEAIRPHVAERTEARVTPEEVLAAREKIKQGWPPEVARRRWIGKRSPSLREGVEAEASRLMPY